MSVNSRFVRRFWHEVPDRKWATFFCDFYVLLDQETKKKYKDNILGLKALNCGCEGDPHVRIGDTTYSIMSESTTYRAISALCEAEGDYYLALAFMMSARACIPNLSPTPKTQDLTRFRMQTKPIDEQIEELKQKLPESRRDFLKEWKRNV